MLPQTPTDPAAAEDNQAQTSLAAAAVSAHNPDPHAQEQEKEGTSGEDAEEQEEIGEETPEERRRQIKVVGGTATRRRSPKRKAGKGRGKTKAESWPAKPDGYLWLNPTDYGVSLYRFYGMKPSSTGKQIKDIEYRGHFTWPYMEQMYGKPSGRSSSRISRVYFDYAERIGRRPQRSAKTGHRTGQTQPTEAGRVVGA